MSKYPQIIVSLSNHKLSEVGFFLLLAEFLLDDLEQKIGPDFTQSNKFVFFLVFLHRCNESIS